MSSGIYSFTITNYFSQILNELDCEKEQYVDGELVKVKISKLDKEKIIDMCKEVYEMHVENCGRGRFSYNVCCREVCLYHNFHINDPEIRKRKFLSKGDIPGIISVIDERRKERACITIQSKWRQILAKRKLQRLKVTREIELMPELGIKYFETSKSFKNKVDGGNKFD